MSQEGWKNDQEKVRTDLLPVDGLLEEAEIWTLGAAKYEPRNWEKGLAWSRPYGALLRHIFAWWQGEDFDPETGKSHLAHASCCVRMLQCYRLRNVGEDDRPSQTPRPSPVPQQWYNPYLNMGPATLSYPEAKEEEFNK